MSQKIGMLTQLQASNLELRGIIPEPRFVDFWNIRDVLLLMEGSHPQMKGIEARWVAPESHSCKYAVMLVAKKWQSTGGVMQLVDGVVQGRKGHFKVKAPASGAHGRDTQVRQTNGLQLPNGVGGFIPKWDSHADKGE